MTSLTTQDEPLGQPAGGGRPRSAPRTPRRRRGSRCRRVVAVSLAVVVAAALLGNAAIVNGQEEPATGGSVLAVDGVRLHVTQDGPSDAPALVLLHGLGGSTRWWEAVLPTLARSYRVVRVDLLGHGASAKPDGDGYAVTDQATRVGHVLDRLHVRGALLVGHSTGGYVATALAARRRELVRALVLVDTGPDLGAFVSDGPTGRLLDLPVLGQLLWRLRTDGIVRRALGTAFATAFTAPQPLVDDTRVMTYHALTAASHASDDFLRQESMPRRLASLGLPVLVVFGDQDQRWRPGSADAYRSVPGARVEMVAGSGHSPMVEQPARTAELILTFAG